jgi:hypothetical protein
MFLLSKILRLIELSRKIGEDGKRSFPPDLISVFNASLRKSLED